MKIKPKTTCFFNSTKTSNHIVLKLLFYLSLNISIEKLEYILSIMNSDINNVIGKQEDPKDFTRPKGIAPIKQEFLVLKSGKIINWDHVSDGTKNSTDSNDDKNGASSQGAKREHIDDRDNPNKRLRLRGQNKSKIRYQIGKRIVNKKHENTVQYQKEFVDKSSRLCLKYMSKDGYCPYDKKCDYSHDLYKIYKSKEEILFDKPCFIYKSYGRCQYGISCLYAKDHTKVFDDKQKVYNLYDHERWSLNGGREDFIERIKNTLDLSAQHKLRKRNYDFKIVTQATNALYKADISDKKEDNDNDNDEKDKLNNTDEQQHQAASSKRIGAVLVDEFLKGRDYERKKVDFKGKLYLAPLTTVGNLPFRRLCKKYQCDITCAEMSLCSSLLNGNPSEWSHIKRHESEDTFGVQITSNHPDQTTKVVKLLNDQCELDFIDFNCGCPTEFIYQSGAGAGLMNRNSKLRKMIGGASMISKVPITVKLRSGCSEEKNIAHNIINSVIRPFTSKYIGAITVHGRSRQQRYTKLADWDYVNDECGRYVDDIPLIGSGDCISWQEYYGNLEKYKNISAVMIARGALISPWLFTEIKERRTWDITSKERLDIISDYVKFGLDHWGSDTTGAENCRKYLLEWLSFACRYIPVGLLEVLPQKINERPPMYKGRDELETLLSSPAASDWVKISEMFLGKVPENFKFLPKHKANAYESINVEG